MSKITCVRIAGKKYNVAMLTPLTLAEFVVDIERGGTETVAKKYGVIEVK